MRISDAYFSSAGQCPCDGISWSEIASAWTVHYAGLRLMWADVVLCSRPRHPFLNLLLFSQRRPHLWGLLDSDALLLPSGSLQAHLA